MDTSSNWEGPHHADARVVADRLLQGSPVGVIALSADLRITYVTDTGARFIGMTVDDLLGRFAHELIHPDDVSMVAQSLALVSGGRSVLPTISRLLRPDGTECSVEGIVQSSDPDSERFRFVLLLRDPTPLFFIDDFVTATLHSDLGDALRCLIGLIEADSDFQASIHWDLQDGVFSQFTALNAQVAALAGHEAITRRLATVHDQPTLNCNLSELGVDTSGTDRQSIYAMPVGSGRDSGVVVGWFGFEAPLGPAGRRFFTRTARLAELALVRQSTDMQLHLAATTDPLTKLANRAAIHKHLETTLRHNQLGALVLVDLDGFKQINDLHGHAAGDHVLIETAKRLVEQSPPKSVVARLGGDEFAVALSFSGETLAEYEDAMTRVEAALEQPIASVFGDLRVGASIGLARATTFSSATDLLAAADRAMYANKRQRKLAADRGLTTLPALAQPRRHHR